MKDAMPDRLMVGHQFLVLSIGVRVPVGQQDEKTLKDTLDSVSRLKIISNTENN